MFSVSFAAPTMMSPQAATLHSFWASAARDGRVSTTEIMQACNLIGAPIDPMNASMLLQQMSAMGLTESTFVNVLVNYYTQRQQMGMGGMQMQPQMGMCMAPPPPMGMGMGMGMMPPPQPPMGMGMMQPQPPMGMGMMQPPTMTMTPGMPMGMGMMPPPVQPTIIMAGPNYRTCHKCGGTGIKIRNPLKLKNWIKPDKPCKHCRGTGRVPM
ncbi:hypothetical protein PAPYR_6927 [Paratrimastix pyriformis]|uniref:Uncharacterized protein n=1 Tax=Paratrimastix pyriformis TaxID=342808 RepID=A0ABQ8UE60_9EUKA|nr:hypothetical protein PAPYR_6927 [Paratrimastix pyriformis]